MKRWLRIGFIFSYLGVLSYGIACHTFGYGVTQHTAMYFIVWDMFCGWGSYASQTHIIAEGESQKYYELAPGPWGDLKPWGKLGRQHYDAFNSFGWRMARNTLQHTQHEPITRIFVVEECWSKKFDLPDHVWKLRYDEPKKPQKYCHLRSEFTGDGVLLHSFAPWIAIQNTNMVSNNPRLQADASRGRSLLMVESQRPGRQFSVSPGFERGGEQSAMTSVGSTHGN